MRFLGFDFKNTIEVVAFFALCLFGINPFISGLLGTTYEAQIMLDGGVYKMGRWVARGWEANADNKKEPIIMDSND